MGQREVTETVKRLVPTCDVCGKDSPTTYQRSCFVCGRACCYRCLLGKQLAGDNTKLLELFVNACRECDAADKDVCGTPFSELVREAVAKADDQANLLLARWRAWSAERRAKQ